MLYQLLSKLLLSYIISWEPDGCKCCLRMFHWEPEWCYSCTKSVVLVQLLFLNRTSLHSFNAFLVLSWWCIWSTFNHLKGKLEILLWSKYNYTNSLKKIQLHFVIFHNSMIFPPQLHVIHRLAIKCITSFHILGLGLLNNSNINS